MSVSSANGSAPALKTPNPDRTADSAAVGAGMTKPRRSRRRFFMIGGIGAALLIGGIWWYLANAGYEDTDDAAIEAHVIQVSPKISAYVKAVHFDDNYAVKRGDLLIELDPRDFESQPGQRRSQPGLRTEQARRSRSTTECRPSGARTNKSGSGERASDRR
jgi:membrane fusion protein, multidrug efflux system